MNKVPIRSFSQLKAWQYGHMLVLKIHRAAIAFPSIESFGLTSHIKKTATSVTSNIAEGFGRTSKKEKIRFYDIAMGSLRELQTQLLIARDLHYIPQNTFREMADLSVLTAKTLSGLMNSIKQR